MPDVNTTFTSSLDQASTSRVLDAITDWYLPAQIETGWVYPETLSIKDRPELLQAAREMAELSAQQPDEDFTIRHNGRLYRGHRIPSIAGPLVCLRRSPSMVPPLEKIGLQSAVQTLLLHPRLSKGGLIIIAGETGQGKSTTAGATLRARIERFNAFCLTIEDPPELPLHGPMGSGGMCVQTDVAKGNFADALRGAMRSYPTQGNSILFVGETRSAESASEVLRIATNGHLVLTTLHAEDNLGAIQRFLSLASSQKSMSELEAREVFSAALRLVLHQKLRTHPQTGARQLEAKVLFSPDRSSSVANRIRQGSIPALATDLQQQEILIKLNQVERLLASAEGKV